MKFSVINFELQDKVVDVDLGEGNVQRNHYAVANLTVKLDKPEAAILNTDTIGMSLSFDPAYGKVSLVNDQYLGCVIDSVDINDPVSSGEHETATFVCSQVVTKINSMINEVLEARGVKNYIDKSAAYSQQFLPFEYDN